MAANQADNTGIVEQNVLVRVLGGGARVRILSVLLGEQDCDLNASTIAEKANVDRATFYRHIDELRAWGLVEQTREIENSKMYQINKDSEAAQKLAGLEWSLLEHLADKEDADETDERNWPVIAGDA